MSDMELALRLTFKDQLSGPMNKAVQQVERDTRNLKETVDKLDQAFDKATRKAGEGFTSLNSALGMTSKKVEEAATQVEKQATRMQRAMEMAGKAGQIAAQGVRAWGQVAAGYEAGKYILSPPIARSMTYDQQLAYTSNTTLAGQSLEARRAGKATINAGIEAAVKAGGGSRENALAAFAELVGSGVYGKDYNQALKALPSVVGAATGNAGTSLQFANIALAAKRGMGLDDADRVFNMATRAGQLGGFEIGDMAKGLPAQLANAKSAGLRGYGGYATLLALNQAAVSTAGTKDEAGNNVVNLLHKISSPDTAKDFKKQGIDLNGSMLSAMNNGVNSLDAFGGLVDHVVAKDPRYAALKKKALTTTGDEQKQVYESMAQIVEGAGIGKVIQDRQALMAFLAFRNQQQSYKANTESILNPGNAWRENLDLVKEGQSFRSDQVTARNQFAESKAFNVYGGVLGKATDGLIKFADTYPNLTAAANAAAVALTAVASVAGAAGLVGILTGKVNPADLLKKPGQVLGKAKALASTAPAALSATGLGAGTALAFAAPLALGGDTRVAPISELEQRIKSLRTDLSMARKGFRRDEGWMFDSYDPVKNKSEQDALIAKLVTALQNLNVSVQIDGREVAKSVNQSNSQDGRRQ